MKIFGHFKDINENTITVIIYNADVIADDINIDTSEDICFNADPVIIESSCEDSFTHILQTKCTINLQTRTWLGDYLFANNAESIVVNVIRTKDGSDEILFAGYVVPCTYNQDYAYEWENIEVNAVDYLSVLEYKRPNDNTDYNELRTNMGLHSFKGLIEEMSLNNTRFNISNLPDLDDSNSTTWVETDITWTNSGPVALETEVYDVNSYAGVKLDRTRLGNTPLNVTYIQSDETTVNNGILYYKDYAYVTLNGEQYNTGKWKTGSRAPMPIVIDTVNTLDGWTHGAQYVPFEYFEHFRVDYAMDDGRVKRGDNDTIGSQIPLYPATTSYNSYYNVVQDSVNNLEIIDGNAYYKNYGWVYCCNEYSKTNDWERGQLYIPSYKIYAENNDSKAHDTETLYLPINNTVFTVGIEPDYSISSLSLNSMYISNTQWTLNYRQEGNKWLCELVDDGQTRLGTPLLYIEIEVICPDNSTHTVYADINIEQR